MGVSGWEKRIAFRHNHNDQEVWTKLMALCKRRHADTPTRRHADTFPLGAFDAVFTGADEDENDQDAQHFD
jgi:hypothetical protein